MSRLCVDCMLGRAQTVSQAACRVSAIIGFRHKRAERGLGDAAERREKGDGIIIPSFRADRPH